MFQLRRIDGLQGFQQGIETLRHFGELGLWYLQPYSMAQGPYLFSGQVHHVSLLAALPRAPLPARQVRKGSVQRCAAAKTSFSRARAKARRSPAPHWVLRTAIGRARCYALLMVPRQYGGG